MVTKAAVELEGSFLVGGEGDGVSFSTGDGLGGDAEFIDDQVVYAFGVVEGNRQGLTEFGGDDVRTEIETAAFDVESAGYCWRS